MDWYHDPNTWDVARAAKESPSPPARDFSAFLNSHNIPACLDHQANSDTKTIRYFFNIKQGPYKTLKYLRLETENFFQRGS